MTFKNRRARASQPSGGIYPSALAIEAGLATLTTFVQRERSVYGNIGLTRVGTAHAPQTTFNGRGLATTASATYWAGAAGAKVVCAGTSFAVLLSFQLRAPGQTNRYALFERLTGGTGSQNAVLYGYATDQFEFYSPSATGTDPRTGSGITVSDSLPHTLLYTYDGAIWSGYLDGNLVFSTSRTFGVPLNDATGISAIGDAAGGNSLDICVLHHATFSRGLSPALARRFTSPVGQWSIFAGPKRRIWTQPSAAGAHDATGSVVADSATVAGSAAAVTTFTSSGALSAAAATVAGSANHVTVHASSGALSADAATVAGTAAHSAPGSFSSSGDLSAGVATVSGTATHLTLHTATGVLVADPASVSGAAVDETTYVPPAPSTGAGRSKRKRQRYEVEIDGEVFTADSVDQALEILDQAKQQAKAVADLAVERAAKAKKREPRKVLADAEKALQLPDIKAPPELRSAADAAMADIQALYEQAAQAIEIEAAMRRREAEIEADDEDILLLL